MQYVLSESSNTSLSADRANSCIIPELLQLALKAYVGKAKKIIEKPTSSGDRTGQVTLFLNFFLL